MDEVTKHDGTPVLVLVDETAFALFSNWFIGGWNEDVSMTSKVI